MKDSNVVMPVAPQPRVKKTVQLLMSEIELTDNHRADESDGLIELMASMKTIGLLQPVGVVERNGKYTLAYGYRRFGAAKALGWTSITATLNDENDDEALAVMNLAENVQRKQVSTTELGQYLNSLIQKGWSKKVLAMRLGVSLNFIEVSLRAIYDVPEEYRHLVMANTQRGAPAKGGQVGQLTMRQVNAISSYGKARTITRDERVKLFEAAVKGGSDFDVKQVPAYHANIAQGKPWNSNVERMRTIGNLIWVRDSEMDRLREKYINNPDSPYTSLRGVCVAIMRGELAERIDGH